MTGNPPNTTTSRWADELGLPVELSLVTLFARAQLLLTQGLERITLAAGVSAADFFVIGVVCRSPGHRGSPTRVCEILGRTTGGLTPTIDRLEAAGLLQRLPDPSDRRRLVLEATPICLELHARVNRELAAWQDSLGLDDSARHALRSGLGVLVERLEEQQEGRVPPPGPSSTNAN